MRILLAYLDRYAGKPLLLPYQIRRLLCSNITRHSHFLHHFLFKFNYNVFNQPKNWKLLDRNQCIYPSQTVNCDEGYIKISGSSLTCAKHNRTLFFRTFGFVNIVVVTSSCKGKFLHRANITKEKASELKLDSHVYIFLICTWNQR